MAGSTFSQAYAQGANTQATADGAELRHWMTDDDAEPDDDGDEDV